MTPQVFALLLLPFIALPCVDFIVFGEGNFGSDNEFCIGTQINGGFLDVYTDESFNPQCGQTVLELFNIMNNLPSLPMRWGCYGGLSQDTLIITPADLSINSEGCLEIRVDDSNTNTLL